jgi:hypothetical protein
MEIRQCLFFTVCIKVKPMEVAWRLDRPFEAEENRWKKPNKDEWFIRLKERERKWSWKTKERVVGKLFDLKCVSNLEETF